MALNPKDLKGELYPAPEKFDPYAHIPTDINRSGLTKLIWNDSCTYNRFARVDCFRKKPSFMQLKKVMCHSLNLISGSIEPNEKFIGLVEFMFINSLSPKTLSLEKGSFIFKSFLTIKESIGNDANKIEKVWGWILSEEYINGLEPKINMPKSFKPFRTALPKSTMGPDKAFADLSSVVDVTDDDLKQFFVKAQGIMEDGKDSIDLAFLFKVVSGLMGVTLRLILKSTGQVQESVVSKYRDSLKNLFLPSKIFSIIIWPSSNFFDGAYIYVTSGESEVKVILGKTVLRLMAGYYKFTTLYDDPGIDQQGFLEATITLQINLHGMNIFKLAFEARKLAKMDMLKFWRTLSTDMFENAIDAMSTIAQYCSSSYSVESMIKFCKEIPYLQGYGDCDAVPVATMVEQPFSWTYGRVFDITIFAQTTTNDCVKFAVCMCHLIKYYNSLSTIEDSATMRKFGTQCENDAIHFMEIWKKMYSTTEVVTALKDSNDEEIKEAAEFAKLWGEHKNNPKPSTRKASKSVSVFHASAHQVSQGKNKVVEINKDSIEDMFGGEDIPAENTEDEVGEKTNEKIANPFV